MMADTSKAFQAEATAALPQRVSATNIQGLDQVIAISEDCINSIIATRFSNQLKRKKDRRLREFKHGLPDYGTIDGTLSAPRVQMAVPYTPDSVYFFVNFEQGSFQYWTGFGPNAKPHTQDLKGWSVGFKTSFGLSKLATVPKDIADQITLLKPGSYSASQLLLGFSAAATAELVWSVSTCPGLEEDRDLQFASQNMFKQYMDIYLRWMATGPYSVLGYAIKVEDNSTDSHIAAPSFPPTDVKCRTQEYVPQTDAFRKQYPGRGGLDFFLFEEMSESRAFPEVPYDPAKAGNWIVGGIAANLTMSRSIFLEKYLMTRLDLLNMQCITLANDSYFWVSQQKGWKMTGNDWILTQYSKVTTAAWVPTDIGATYSWTGKNFKSNNSIWTGQWRDNLTTIINNVMKWAPGSDTVTVEVDIKQNRDQWTGGHGESTDTLSGGDTAISWKVVITLGTIKDGELDIQVTYGTPTLSYKYQSTQLAWDWGGSLKASYETTAMDALKGGADLSSIQNSLKGALSGQSRFVFPGGGDFYMKNTKFNNRGDLLIELSYIAKAIEVDFDFHLQVSAPELPEVNGKWLKVSTTSTESNPVNLVADQKDATVFQIDNGDLVVDQSGFPTGSRAITKVLGSNSKVQDLLLVTQDAFDKSQEKEKLECSMTGSKFAYALDGGTSNIWYGTFALDPETETKLQLFTGDAGHPDPYMVLSVNAIY